MPQNNLDSGRPSIETEVLTIQGFRVHVLKSRQVELAIVPALGAKIISLKNRNTGREWLWHPDNSLKLFKNKPADDFSLSPLVGIDECLPTIAPCSWQDRQLPDHGEVWSLPWNLNDSDWTQSKITTGIRLKISPFEFERTVELMGNSVQLSYKLTNLSSADESYLWAMHPLIRTEKDDQLEFPSSTIERINAGKWDASVTSIIPEGESLKAFARPVSEGQATIRNTRTGDRLEFSWNPAENNTLGLWLTRGGWHGHHHLAVEPTNATDDALTIAVQRDEGGHVSAHGTKKWTVTLRLGI